MKGWRISVRNGDDDYTCTASVWPRLVDLPPLPGDAIGGALVVHTYDVNDLSFEATLMVHGYRAPKPTE